MPPTHPYRLTISYLGTRYAGWQRQPNALTVQEVLEDALEELLGEPVRLLGASRTDSGVHARGQVAGVGLSRPWPVSALVHGTNSRLPEDVRVLAAAEAPPGFHPQRDARGKEYRYRLVATAVLSPLDAATAVRIDPGLDLEAMAREARALVGSHDFRAFAKSGGSHEDSRRTVFAASWEVRGPEWTFRIVGDGFLRGMVRAVVGTLLEAGRGRRRPGSLQELLAGADRRQAGPNAPARGLVLHRVFYEAEELDRVAERVGSLW